MSAAASASATGASSQRPQRPRASQRTTSSAPAKKLSSDQGIDALTAALDVLEALASLGPAPLCRIAEAAKCSHGNALRLLQTLQTRGFALYDEAADTWRLGARWSALGRAAQDQGALAATARPFLAELGQAIGENTYLLVRDGVQAETAAVFQVDPAMRLYTPPGERRLMHAGNGRLLLAYAPEAVQTQLLAQRLPRFTPATRTDPAWIAADLPRLRVRGYAVTADEVFPGSVSLSAPVRDASGQVVGAICITAPSMRMRPPRPRSLLPQLLETAASLSRTLGGTPNDETTGGTQPSASGGRAPRAPHV